jgi:hypothetical protein
MQSPLGMTPNEFKQRYDEYFEAVEFRLGVPYHKVCGSEIKLSAVVIQYHASCNSTTRLWSTQLPYCPACEDPPRPLGCLHMIVDLRQQPVH